MSQFKDHEREALAAPTLKVTAADQLQNESDGEKPDAVISEEELRERAKSLVVRTHQSGPSTAQNPRYSSPYDEALADSDRSWQSINQFFEIAQRMFIFILTGCCIVLAMAAFMYFQKQNPGASMEIPDLSGLLGPFLGTHNFKNVSNMTQVLNLLPWAAFGCALTTAFATYIARSAKSREIDWTDSHLMLEYSGPINLAFKWTAIKSVDQIWKWDIFHGRQPVFLLTTNEGNVFTLKLSDISAKNNVGSFFSLIKEHAPKAKFNVDPAFATDESYTELWLKYFSKATDRTRSGLLEKDMLVCDGMYRVVGTIGGGGQGTAYLAIVEKNTVPDSAYGREGVDGKVEVSMGNKEARHIMKVDPATKEQRKKLVVGQEVVLKEYVLPVHRGQLTAERTAEKLKAEAEILDKLDHEHIVKLKDAFIEDYRGYLVLDFVSGESLKTITDRRGPQPEEAVIDWAIQVLDILSYMHSLTPSLVHRDITPDNLMLQEDGFIKLVDFNVAYQVDSSATATVVGKHAYIPAEQFRGKPTPQSDIYSLGGTMFYLLTGKEPEPISQSSPQNHRDDVSTELDSIVMKATASRLDERYANVEAFKADLLKLKK